MEGQLDHIFIHFIYRRMFLVTLGQLCNPQCTQVCKCLEKLSTSLRKDWDSGSTDRGYACHTIHPFEVESPSPIPHLFIEETYREKRL